MSEEEARKKLEEFWKNNRLFKGVVKDSKGNPLGNCTVKIFRVGDNAHITTVTSDANGKFTVIVPAGATYYFKAYKKLKTASEPRKASELRKVQKSSRNVRILALFLVLIGLTEIGVCLMNVDTPYYWLHGIFQLLFLLGAGTIGVAIYSNTRFFADFLALCILFQSICVPLVIAYYPTPFSHDDSINMANAWIQKSPDLLSKGLANAIIRYGSSAVGIPADVATWLSGYLNAADYIAGLIKPYLTGLLNWRYIETLPGTPENPFAVLDYHIYLVTFNLPTLKDLIRIYIAIKVGGGASLISKISGCDNRVLQVALATLMIGNISIIPGKDLSSRYYDPRYDPTPIVLYAG